MGLSCFNKKSSLEKKLNQETSRHFPYEKILDINHLGAFTCSQTLFVLADLENDVLIGVSVVGGVLLFLLILATCFIAIRVWRRKRRSNCQKVPPEGFENKGHIRY